MTMRARIRFPATDIFDTPDDGKMYEVVDGALYVTPPPGSMHQNAVGVLFYLVMSFVRPRNLGKVYPAPIGVVLDDENGVEPDIVYVSSERLSIVSERGIEGAPDMVAEVLSPRTKARDRGVKMRRYAAAGVQHYWILDPANRTLEAYRLGSRGYELIGSYGPGTVFRPELFPGLEMRIDDLWS